MDNFQIVFTVSVFALCTIYLVPGGSGMTAYEFGYGVNDPVTGDIKDQREIKNGDQVTGYYRLLDADGLVRTVRYQSNPLTGFQAHVSRDPIGIGEDRGQFATLTGPADAVPVRLLNPSAASVLTAPTTAVVPETKEISYVTSSPFSAFESNDGSIDQQIHPMPTSYQKQPSDGFTGYRLSGYRYYTNPTASNTMRLSIG